MSRDNLLNLALIAVFLAGLGACLWARNRMLKTLKPTDPSIWDMNRIWLRIRSKEEFIFAVSFFVMMTAFFGLMWPVSK